MLLLSRDEKHSVGSPGLVIAIGFGRGLELGKQSRWVIGAFENEVLVYTLFAINSKGVPSIAKIVKVELPSRHTPPSYEYEEDENFDEEDCDLDEKMGEEVDKAEVEADRILAIVAEKTGKFWRAWKSAFVLQA